MVGLDKTHQDYSFTSPHVCAMHNREQIRFHPQPWTAEPRAEAAKEKPTMSYERILSIENLSDVPNPWKGLSMNRCLVVALVVMLVSSGVNEVHDALDYLVEESGIVPFFGSLQNGSCPQIPMWDSLKTWWGSEEVGAIRRRKRPIGSKAVLKPKPKE